MTSKPNSCTVKVVQYNILAEPLANKTFYINATDEEVDAKLRWSKISAKLRSHMTDGDILCLQEVGKRWLGKLHVLASLHGLSCHQ